MKPSVSAISLTAKSVLMSWVLASMIMRFIMICCAVIPVVLLMTLQKCDSVNEASWA